MKLTLSIKYNPSFNVSNISLIMFFAIIFQTVISRVFTQYVYNFKPSI